MLGNGGIVGKLETSWDALLHHGNELFNISFPPVDDVHPSLVLKVSVLPPCDNQESALLDFIVECEIARETDAGHEQFATYVKSKTPPTRYLSRTYTPLTSPHSNFTIPLPTSASRFTVCRDDESKQPLTDRYGFIYDISQYDDVLLLVRAKECSKTATACLTSVKIADRKTSNFWSDDDDNDQKNVIEIVKGSCTCNGEGTPISPVPSGPSNDKARATPSPEGSSASSSSSRPRSNTVTSTATPLAVHMLHSSTAILTMTQSTPRHICANVIFSMT
ncbi:hypothetical protein BDR04DRAFT_1162866 [Suillus decipiens]|nr:hypothetical protein BDR04DRAFT_1162866 [Suillus decipiens]